MKNYDIATRTIHAGQEPDPSTGAIMTPIYATSTYVQESPGKHKGYDYSRSINPTRLAYEKCVADLESGTRSFAIASVLVGVANIIDFLDNGRDIVVRHYHYGSSFRLLNKVRQQGTWGSNVVPAKLRRRHCRSVRQLSRFAKFEDTRIKNGTSLR